MSKPSGKWLNKLFGKVSQDQEIIDIYKKGDIIGQKYEVYGVLGKGGFSVVYLAYSLEMKRLCVLKIFQDKFLVDLEIRKRFVNEASIWVELGSHPHLVQAYSVDEISGGLYIAMECIPINEDGQNSLRGYLKQQPLGLAQSLNWAIQICHGMEYAYTKGVHAHRDLKPVNIMITPEKTVKITDFGLAGILSGATDLHDANYSDQQIGTGRKRQITPEREVGTPSYMAPEQFVNAAGCDERSDIYSIGIVLYQMTTGGRLPFVPQLPRDGSAKDMEIFWRSMEHMHDEAPVPKLDTPLFPIIQRCLEKTPEKRYQTFEKLRKDLELFLPYQTSKMIKPAPVKEPDAWEWDKKGVSFIVHGKNEEAIRCFDKAIALKSDSAPIWINKGISLYNLGRHEQAIGCFDKALDLYPYDAVSWNLKGSCLDSLAYYEDALSCYDTALELDQRYVDAWYNKGVSLVHLDRYEEALRCYGKALKYNPSHEMAWCNKGNSLDHLDRYQEAIYCYDRALELDPRLAILWNNKGNSLKNMGRNEDAIRYLDKALELDPSLVIAWQNKGISLGNIGLYQEAISCFDQVLSFDPRDAAAWNNKGYSLNSLGRYEEAIRCSDKALELDLCDANAWFNKALAKDKLGQLKEAELCYQQFLALARAQNSQYIEQARQRLRELGSA